MYLKHLSYSFPANRLRFALFILLSTPFFAAAQFDPHVKNYYQYLDQATIAQSKNRTDEAIAYAEKAEKEFKESKDLYLLLGNLYMVRKDYGRATASFKTAILKGLTIRAPQDLFDNYELIKNEPEIKAFAAVCDSMQKKFIASCDMAFANLIVQLEKTDLDGRQNKDGLHTRDTASIRQYKQIIMDADSSNAAKLLEYCRTSQIPYTSKYVDAVKLKFFEIIHHILQHPPTPIFSKVEALMGKAMYEGRYPREWLVCSLDLRNILAHGKQRFGSYMEKDENGYYYTPAIDSIGTVDKRRAAFLLPSLADASAANRWHPRAPGDYKSLALDKAATRNKALYNASYAQKDTFHLYFLFGKNTLNESELRKADTIIYTKKLYDANTIRLIGFADSPGGDSLNFRISFDRARAVQNYLVKSGVALDKIIETTGLGAVSHGSNKDSNKQDRRVDLVVLKKRTVEDIQEMRENETIALKNLLFEGGRHIFVEKSYTELEQLYKVMKNNPTLKIRLEGHICCVAFWGFAYNGIEQTSATKDPLAEYMLFQKMPATYTADFDLDDNTGTLSLNRAKAVYNYLVSKGIDKNRMSCIGFGGSRPLILPEVSSEDQDKNRRVEVRIISK